MHVLVSSASEVDFKPGINLSLLCVCQGKLTLVHQKFYMHGFNQS